MSKSSPRLWPLTALLLIGSACAGGGATRTEVVTERGAIEPMRSAIGDVAASIRTEGHAIAVLRETNRAEIDAGEIARTRASREDVRAFATKMVAEHTALDRQIAEHASYSGIAVALPSQALPDLQRSELETLSRQVGGAFDRTYLQQQIDAHQRSLTLVGAAERIARNEQLRAMLATVVRPRIEAHLREAIALDARR